MAKSRVLLIEDDSMFGEIIQIQMEKKGFQVDWAKSWKEAEIFFNVKDPNYAVIFTDNDFPGGSGAKTAETAKRLWGDIPVFLVSGRADEVAKEFMDAGGTKVFLKFDIADAIKHAIAYTSGAL